MSTLNLVVICATVCFVSAFAAMAVEVWAKAKYSKKDTDQ
jgi:hypothetical protein